MSTQPRETLAAAPTLEDRARVEARRAPGVVAANRRLFKAYVLREQLHRLRTYKTRPGVLDLLLGWIKALR